MVIGVAGLHGLVVQRAVAQTDSTSARSFATVHPQHLEVMGVLLTLPLMPRKPNLVRLLIALFQGPGKIGPIGLHVPRPAGQGQSGGTGYASSRTLRTMAWLALEKATKYQRATLANVLVSLS